MIVAIILSLIPLAFKDQNAAFNLIDKLTVALFTFGAINSISSNVPVTDGYENIHNVYNDLDTFAPGQFGAVMLNGAGKKYGKFGHLETFSYECRSSGDMIKPAIVQAMDHINHDMSRYVEAVEIIYDEDDEYAINFKYHCKEHYQSPQAISVSSVTAGASSITIKWKRADRNAGVKGKTRYQIQYSTNKNFSKPSSKKVTGVNNLSVSINGFEGSKTYYIRIRSYNKYSDDTFYDVGVKTPRVS